MVHLASIIMINSKNVLFNFYQGCMWCTYSTSLPTMYTAEHINVDIYIAIYIYSVEMRVLR